MKVNDRNWDDFAKRTPLHLKEYSRSKSALKLLKCFKAFKIDLREKSVYEKNKNGES